MASKEASETLIPKARVQWWICTFCACFAMSSIVTTCQGDEIVYSKYEIEFSQGTPSLYSYEIDKETFRFIAGGARVPKISNNEIGSQKNEIEKSIYESQNMTTSIKSDISEAALAKIEDIKCKMMKSTVEDAQSYLKDIPEVIGG
ncbi:uncharacterized protein F4812DRAFT_460452 [Daldinia caldariorum]|uniref:uncharacterized protein n=1 Tax=Daldinia caldariorum TaxID=326644 RepID=UPI00200802EE|nr:uncharacterized protein F4812DRAFT_460452 [Daldinia caldariorum]KAI1466895.1 hypothetical protein F4812DRAFT_460452 [Daldinia caldariorum]